MPQNTRTLHATFEEFPSVSYEEWVRAVANQPSMIAKGTDPSEYSLVFSAINTEATLPLVDSQSYPKPVGHCVMEVPLHRAPGREAIRELSQLGAEGLRGPDHCVIEALDTLSDLDHPFSRLSIKVNHTDLDQLAPYLHYLRSTLGSRRPVGGTIHLPVAHWSHGQDHASVLDFLTDLLKEVVDLPAVRVVAVPGNTFYERGASVVDELAMTLSGWVAHCDQLTDAGTAIEEVLARTEITLATGTDFFSDLAKFRALRVLTDKVAEAYGVDTASDRLPSVRAVSGTLNKTLYDPDSNLLRNTTEALAAMLGGANVLSLQPHDFLYDSVSDFGTRLTIQVHNMLRHEAHADHVYDPAAGSFFIEDITRQLVEKSWEVFLLFEEQGGFQKLLSDGSLEARCRDHLTAQSQQIATQKKVMVGATRYTNPLENITAAYDETPTRLAASFEKIRYAMDQRVEGQMRPTVPLWIQQEVSAVGLINQRVNYVKDLLTSVGLAYEEHGMTTAQDFVPADAAETSQAGVIFCGTDAFYESTVAPLCQQNNSLRIVVAGGSRVVVETIRQAGGRGVLGIGHDVISLVAQLIQDET